MSTILVKIVKKGYWKAAWRGRNRSELEHPDDYKLEKKARGKSEGLVKEPHGQYI